MPSKTLYKETFKTEKKSITGNTLKSPSGKKVRPTPSNNSIKIYKDKNGVVHIENW